MSHKAVVICRFCGRYIPAEREYAVPAGGEWQCRAFQCDVLQRSVHEYLICFHLVPFTFLAFKTLYPEACEFAKKTYDLPSDQVQCAVHYMLGRWSYDEHVELPPPRNGFLMTPEQCGLYWGVQHREPTDDPSTRDEFIRFRRRVAYP